MELSLEAGEQSEKDFKNWAGMQVIRQKTFIEYEISDSQEQEFYDKVVLDAYNYITN